MSFPAFAQLLTPGAVFTSKGDSVRGESFFRDWDISPSSIDFRPAQGNVDPMISQDLRYIRETGHLSELRSH
jgi:hypothetical protein